MSNCGGGGETLSEVTFRCKGDIGVAHRRLNFRFKVAGWVESLFAGWTSVWPTAWSELVRHHLLRSLIVIEVRAQRRSTIRWFKLKVCSRYWQLLSGLWETSRVNALRD